MTDQPHTHGRSLPGGRRHDELCLAAALQGQLRATTDDGVPRIGVFTTKNGGHGVELSSARLPLPGGGRVDPDQRLARYINTVAEIGTATAREVFLASLDASVLAWWMTLGYPDAGRLVVAATPTGGWFDATVTEPASEPTVCAYEDGHAPAGIEEIVGFLGELACPVTLRRQTHLAWAASETRMCGCWHAFTRHDLDGPAHPCEVADCGCRRFDSTDGGGPGRWVPDTPAALAALQLTGRCATAAHHTRADGQRWHWVPDFLTRIPA